MKSHIGLKRGTVSLSPHNKNWAKLFEAEKKRLQKILGSDAVDIQHIGSTSIPEIVAKPVIDIDVGLESLTDREKIIKVMEKQGYFHRPNAEKRNQQILFAKGNEIKRTHYIHILKYNGAIWKKDLKFRDYLRAHPKQAKQYEKLKKELAKKHSSNRLLYTKAKTDFILKIICPKSDFGLGFWV